MSPGVLDSQRNSGRAGALFEFTQGVDVDARLAESEVRVQKAWARALGRAGRLAGSDVSRVEAALDEAQGLIRSGRFAWRVEDEDIHMNLERFVTERAGDLGKRMHLGRSRNDLIATTLRLHAAAMASEACAGLRELVLALCDRARRDVDVIVPGLTHLQHGQPVRHGHALAAHGWAFRRDLERVRAAGARALEAMPLGSAALAGTSVTVDLDALAGELGFSSPLRNSYDAVGDRDFLLELLDAYAQAAVHLSRIAEDCVYWASTGVGLVRLPLDWSTGSSIMPNKRNPDVAELARGKSAHLIAAAANAHILMKAVPTSYGSDLHELKGVALRSHDELMACLRVFPPFVKGLEPDVVRANALLKRGHVLATEIADELAVRGVPFREAYAQVAALVQLAESRGIQVEDIPPEEARKQVPTLDAAFLKALSPESAVERRSLPGGTARARVLEAIGALERGVGLISPRGECVR